MSIDLKKNKSLVFGGGILALLIAVAGFFLWKFSGAHKDAREQAENVKSQLVSLGNKAITPGAANVQILGNNIDYLENFTSNYVAKLFSSLPPAPQISPSQFQESTEKDLGELERVAREKGILLGDAVAETLSPIQPGLPVEDSRFYFSFERFTEEGKKPDAKEIPRLSLQLAVVQDLVNILLDTTVEYPVPGSTNEMMQVHIDSIDSVQRETFERVDDGFGSQGFAPGPQSFALPPAAGAELPEEPLYDKERFAIGFTGEEQHVWQFLNRVNELPYPAIVSQLRLRNTNPELQPFVEAIKSANSAQMPLSNDDLEDGDVPGEAKLHFISGDEAVSVQVEITIAKPAEPKSNEGFNQP